MKACAPAPDPLDVVIEQIAYLVATVRAGQHTDSELNRMVRVQTILLEPFAERAA